MTYKGLLILVSIIYTLAVLIIGYLEYKNKKYAFFKEIIIIYVLYILFAIVQYKFKLNISIFIILLILLTSIGNNYIGEYLKYFHKSKTYDRFLHAFGAFSFSLFIYSILDKITFIYISKVNIFIYVATIGISFGCIYEIYEFILDRTKKTKNQHGLTDTNFDLISDVIGSIIAGSAACMIFI